MSPRRTGATAGRVLRQLRRDPRTVALLLVVPCVLLALLAGVLNGSSAAFDAIGPALLAVFPFVSMFLVTSVATLRERTSGTLERLLTMPVAKLDVLLGYGIAFGAVAVVQALLACGTAVGLLGMHVSGSLGALIGVAVLDAVLGVALGLLVSAFAATEFQAVQCLPAVVLPQFLLCGLIAPRHEMWRALELLSDVLPLTYAVDAMSLIQRAGNSGTVVRDAGLVAAYVVAALALGALTLRRRTS
jgi:ABC-2 type transport system permease protein